ncbi:MAG: nucleotidyltransferase domain-containing protein [Prevotellaceae bacterium]|jgi:predicted nucleotidyltransferase|nr:nucleotidyltransferase domain-containing protein [Prevotellaceae bacterium]
MDKRNDIIDKVNAYKELVKKSFPVRIEQFYIFGSYAGGTPREYSDIDVALVVSHLNDDYSVLNTEPILWALSEQVDSRIEPHVIARDTDCTGFLDEIKRTGIEI